VSVFGGGMDMGPRGDKGLHMGLMQLLRMAWADPDLRSRIMFVLFIFAVFTAGVHIPVPIPGVSAEDVFQKMKDNAFFDLMNTFGGGAIRRISVFSLGLNPYITASIILQVLTQANPAWKKELKEGGEYARRQQNKRTRLLTLGLCIVQSLGLIGVISQALASQSTTGFTPWVKATVVIFWTAGAMFVLWLGEQVSEKGIGNGVSLMIFAGIIVALPTQIGTLAQQVRDQTASIWSVLILMVLFLACTWLVVFFTTAQRRIPMQHMRRNVGTRAMGGQTSYLPLSVNTAGVIPIIFAISLLIMPAQFAAMTPEKWPIHDTLMALGEWLNPIGRTPYWIVGCTFYVVMIFGFTYFYTAIQYNVDDMADHLKRSGAFIPGVRPGKQTKDFLDAVISRITIVGAAFLAVIALAQYVGPAITNIHRISIIGGTTLLIVVSVALETMRQIEANLLMKQYGS